MFIKNVALIGMGAIGSVYGKHLYEAYENQRLIRLFLS